MDENGARYTREEMETLIDARVGEMERAMARRLEDARAEGIAQGEARARAAAEEAARTDAAQMAQREAALDERQRQIERRELRAGAAEALRERGLSEHLAECLDYSGAEALAASIDRVEEVVRKAIQEGVDARIAKARLGLPAGGRGAGALMQQVRGVMGLK